MNTREQITTSLRRRNRVAATVSNGKPRNRQWARSLRTQERRTAAAIRTHNAAHTNGGQA